MMRQKQEVKDSQRREKTSVNITQNKTRRSHEFCSNESQSPTHVLLSISFSREEGKGREGKKTRSEGKKEDKLTKNPVILSRDYSTKSFHFSCHIVAFDPQTAWIEFFIPFYIELGHQFLLINLSY